MNLSIGQRIVIGFGLILILTFGFGAYQLTKLSDVRAFSDEIARDNVGVRRLQGKLADRQNDMRVLLERTLVIYLLSKNKLTDENFAAVQQEWQSARRATEGHAKELAVFADKQGQEALSDDRKIRWQRLVANTRDIERALAAISSEVETVFGLMKNDKLVALTEHLPRLDEMRKIFVAQIENGESITRELVDVGQQNIAATYREARQLSMIALAVLLIASAVIAFYLHRSITVPLAAFMGFVERVGRGDLTQKTGFMRGDELGLLAKHLDRMVDGLKEFASQSRSGAENLNSAAAETLASTKQQAASVEEQFAAVQETTATLEEITQSGTQISDRAKRLTAAAEAASSAGQVGLDAVSETARAMDAIREQAEAVAENIVVLSEKTQTIGEIIATVNDIAERSHLLALNAAIEAAAARENGGGFSVVANEIKNLADQAKEATAAVRVNLSDIQQGINTSVMLTEEAVKRIGAGKEKTDSTQRTIHQLTENIQESVQAFQQIVAATNQQQIGLEQVTQALQNIRQASEQTAAGTNQVEQAAANLSALGEQLLRSAGSYKL